MSSAPKTRPKYYDLNLAHLPPPGLVSILHRISGILLFFPILPVILYVLQTSLGSEQDFERWHTLVGRPGVKLIMLGFTWMYAHHFWAGIRYLLLDVHVAIAKQPSRNTAYVVLALGLLTTLLVAWRIW